MAKAKFNSITKVKYHGCEKYPFAVTFVAGVDFDTADPDAICGVHIDFGDKEFVACVSPEEELLVFDVNHETPDVEKERLGIEPLKTSTSQQSVPGIQGQVPVVEEEYARAWSVSACENPSPEDLARIQKVLEVAL
jgi:hypothetical protein